MHGDRLSIRVDAEVQRDLEAIARETGRSESDVAREALRNHIRTRRRRRAESAFDAAIRLGVIACAKGLPRDLSTHRRHMKGFGR
jgi:predicted transcriptional regulator